MVLDGIRIKCIGFSVTTFGKPNYPQAMQQYFDKRGINVEVTYASVGGLSVDSLPYLLEKILQKDQVDIVILEIATSWFSLVRKNEDEADRYIDMIVKYVESMNSSIIFLNLYRKDISDEDNIVQGIRRISEDKYTILDFKNYFRRMLDENGEDGTTDGVHPNPETVEFIAAEVCNKIFKILPNLKKNPIELQENLIYKINTFNILNESVYEFNNNSGIIIECRKIHQGEKVIINTGGKIKISGIFYLMGPDTNQLSMYLDGVHVCIPMRDEASYYRRLGYRYLGSHVCSEIVLEHPMEQIDVKLTREPWEKVDRYCNYIVGFSGHI